MKEFAALNPTTKADFLQHGFDEAAIDRLIQSAPDPKRVNVPALIAAVTQFVVDLKARNFLALAGDIAAILAALQGA